LYSFALDYEVETPLVPMLQSQVQYELGLALQGKLLLQHPFGP
jgi:hypothetical protein